MPVLVSLVVYVALARRDRELGVTHEPVMDMAQTSSGYIRVTVIWRDCHVGLPTSEGVRLFAKHPLRTSQNLRPLVLTPVPATGRSYRQPVSTNIPRPQHAVIPLSASLYERWCGRCVAVSQYAGIHT